MAAPERYSILPYLPQGGSIRWHGWPGLESEREHVPCSVTKIMGTQPTPAPSQHTHTHRHPSHPCWEFARSTEFSLRLWLSSTHSLHGNMGGGGRESETAEVPIFFYVHELFVLSSYHQPPNPSQLNVPFYIRNTFIASQHTHYTVILDQMECITSSGVL